MGRLLYENWGHKDIVSYFDADWTRSPCDRRYTSAYCVLSGGNLISWKSKEQNMQEEVLKLNTELWLVTCELILLKQLIEELILWYWKFETMKLILFACSILFFIWNNKKCTHTHKERCIHWIQSEKSVAITYLLWWPLFLQKTIDEIH